MEFSEQEEHALNASDESESVGPDSAEVDAELTPEDLDSPSEDEVALESEVSSSEGEMLEGDPDSSPELDERPDSDMTPENELSDAEPEGMVKETDTSEQKVVEVDDQAEIASHEAEVKSAGEQIEDLTVDETVGEDEVAEEQEPVEPEKPAETEVSETEIPVLKLETEEEQLLEAKDDKSLIEEGAAALAAEIKKEPPPVLKPEPSSDDDDGPEVSLDFLDQDQSELEEEDGRSWFVVHCYSGYENKVRHNLEQRIETMGMKDKIFDIVVPTEEEIEVREGKRRTVERRVFPGYILVNMVMTEESWYVVRNTPGVTGFVGMGNTPTPLRPEEVSQIIKRMEAEAPRIKVTFKAGERVRIVDGPFNDFRGTVSEIDMERAKVRVMVNFFGRETPVELDFLQVEKT
jgi:transcriptional antiterminator NusG